MRNEILGAVKPLRIEWTIVENQTARPDLVLELDFTDKEISQEIGLRVEEDYGQVALRFCGLDRRVQRGIVEEIFELAERRLRERNRTPRDAAARIALGRPLIRNP
jgi:hypothetical protein